MFTREDITATQNALSDARDEYDKHYHNVDTYLREIMAIIVDMRQEKEAVEESYEKIRSLIAQVLRKEHSRAI